MPPSLQSSLPSEGMIKESLAPEGSVAGAGLILLESERGPEFTIVFCHKVKGQVCSNPRSLPGPQDTWGLPVPATAG